MSRNVTPSGRYRHGQTENLRTPKDSASLSSPSQDLLLFSLSYIIHGGNEVEIQYQSFSSKFHLVCPIVHAHFQCLSNFRDTREVSLKASHGFEYKWILEANQIELETHLSHAELSQLESPELNIKQWSLWPYNSSPRQAFRVTRKSPNAWLADWVTAKATVWTTEDERWNFKCH